MSDKIIETTALPLLTTVAGNTEIVGASGNRIKVESLRPAILGDVNLELIMSNIFIMCHRKRDNFPLMVKPHKWAIRTKPVFQTGRIYSMRWKRWHRS